MTQLPFRPLLFALLVATLGFVACKDDNNTLEENITRVQVHLVGGGLNREFKWEDADGDGGNAPTIEDITLAPNTVYTAYLHVYDGSKEINDEIEAESTSHLFTLTATGADLSIGALSKDSNGQPFGISSTWTTGAASSGSVNIKLYHEPTDKSNTGSPGGEIDLDITLPLKVL